MMFTVSDAGVKLQTSVWARMYVNAGGADEHKPQVLCCSPRVDPGPQVAPVCGRVEKALAYDYT